LPPLGAVVERFIVSRMFGVEGDEATAFSTTMVLGSTRGMLQSDAVVLRIEGERPEYLRGAVYDRYDGHFWLMSGGARKLTTMRADAPGALGTGSTRITLARGAPSGEDMRWFLPGGACDLGVAQGKLETDGFGVARRARADEPLTIGFRRSACSVPPAEIAPPSGLDLELHGALREVISPIATEWTTGADGPRAKLDAIKHRLASFEYSLSVPRRSDLDPVVDFLTVHRAGHCEMFASAMVLLARAEGIPARMVGGFHVVEENPLTGRAVVRDRDAHAWVEAWIDGAWRGWDPTPVGESFAPRRGMLAHVGDLVSWWGERAAVGAARLGTLGTAALLGGLALALSVLRSLGLRIQRRRARRPGLATSSLPLPCFETLTNALAARGLERAESEPIETFARRVSEATVPWAGAAAAALLGYAGLRYGGVGEEAAVVREIERAAREVRA
jgi:hypothetical protein